jgi:hypothetical protein
MMNTKYLMIASSILMGLLGIALSFAPSEVLEAFNQTPNNTLSLFLQLTGALYFGFAMINWMAKAVLIGGIYARPLCIGNFSHFLIAGLALAKASLNSTSHSVFILVLAIAYVFFAALFGYLLLTNPFKKQVHQA